jgi:hypothetical protein
VLADVDATGPRSDEAGGRLAVVVRAAAGLGRAATSSAANLADEFNERSSESDTAPRSSSRSVSRSGKRSRTGRGGTFAAMRRVACPPSLCSLRSIKCCVKKLISRATRKQSGGRRGTGGREGEQVPSPRLLYAWDRLEQLRGPAG